MCAAQPVYQPLDLFGWEWHYVNATGATGQANILGTQVVQGNTTVVRREVLPEQVFENYWTVSPDGDVFLHGAQNFTFPFVVSYAPPILWLDAPLELDKVWMTTTTASFDLEGNDPGEPLDFRLRVFFAGDLTVPFGTFFAFGVGQDPVGSVTMPLPVEAFTATGRQVGDGQNASDGGEPTEWFVDGVGRVKHTQIDAWELTGYSSPSTPVEAVTWAAIKAHFGE